jgi:hypothetical protein
MGIATMPHDSLRGFELWRVLPSFPSYDQWFIIAGFYAVMVDRDGYCRYAPWFFIWFWTVMGIAKFCKYDQWFIIVGFYAVMGIVTVPRDSLCGFGLWWVLPNFISYDQWFIIIGF